MRAALSFVRARPRRALLAVAVLSAWTLAPLRTLHVDNGLSTWFDESEPILQEYRSFQRSYGHDERAIYAVRADWSAAGLLAFKHSTQALGELGTVRSLANATRVRAAEGWLEVGPWIPDDLTEADAAQLRDDVLRDRELPGALVSEDGARLVTVVTLGTEVDHDAVRDARLLGVALRDWRATLGTLAAVALSILWTLAIFASTGASLNLVTLVLPTLLVVVGVANAVHLFAHAGAHEHDPIAGVVDQLRPCTLNTLTTALAFGSLVAAPLPALRALGLFAAIGMAISLVFATFFAAISAQETPHRSGRGLASRIGEAAMSARAWSSGAGSPSRCSLGGGRAHWRSTRRPSTCSPRTTPFDAPSRRFRGSSRASCPWTSC